jgi:hypothetical protein
MSTQLVSKRISELPSSNVAAQTDLLVISADDGDSTYTSKYITVANFSNSIVTPAVPETDPIFIASNAYSITSQDLINIKNTSNVNTGDQDLSTYLTISNAANEYLTQTNASSTYLTISNAASEYIPYLGAVSNVNINTHGLTAEFFKFNTNNTPITNEEGLLQWNATDGTLDLGMSGGDITQQIGQELFIKVYNDTGSIIENGTPVYFSGRQGNRPKVIPARSDSDATSCVCGVTTQQLDATGAGREGFITTFGYVRKIKTNYSGDGDWGTTWSEGNKLYVSKTIAGQLTNVEPIEPHHADVVGEVAIVGNVGIGSIFVRINLHKTLTELSDVDGTPLSTSGQILVWNNSASYFDFNKNINDYLTVSNAASEYLTQANAVNTYLTISDAANTYLTQTNAVNEYLTISNAESIYLTEANAISTYLTINNASNTYLTNVTASLPLSSTGGLSPNIAIDLSNYSNSSTLAATYLTISNAASFVVGSGVKILTVGISQPGSPTTGDLWVDTN